MKKSVVLALTLPFLAGACLVGPDFQRPETTQATSYAAAGDKPLPADQQMVSTTAVPVAWWSSFNAPQLDSVMALAMADNQDVAVTRARIAEAKEGVASARGSLLPQLSLGANVTNTKYGPALFGPSDITIPAFTAYQVGPNLSLPTDFFGGGQRLVEQKAAIAEYRQHEFEAAQLTLQGNVVAQALAMAAARAQIAVVHGVIGDDNQTAQLVQVGINAGAAAQTQLVVAQSQLASDRTLLPDLDQQVAVARHALSVLAGKAPGEWSPPDFDLSDFTLPSEIPASLPSELAHNRPDVLAAEAQLHAASAEVGIATANLYPKFTLSAGMTVQSLALGGPFIAAWSLAAGVMQPIFDGGQLSAERRAAIQRYNATLASYKQTVLNALGQVADLMQAVANDAAALRAQEEAAQTAVRAVDLQRGSFRLGNTGVLDVIDAQRRLAQAQLGVSRARAQRLMDTARLYVALGNMPGGPATPSQ